MNQFVETIAAVPALAPAPLSGEELLNFHFKEAKSLARKGRWILGLGVIPVAAWMAFAPLSASVVASGFMKVDMNRRVIQHAEGGLVRAVHVRDGQHVHKGDTLLELGDVSVSADKRRLAARLLFERASATRAEAEQVRRSSLQWPAELTAGAETDPTLAEQLHKETSLFNARRSSLVSQIDLLQAQKAKINHEKTLVSSQIEQVQESLNAQSTELQSFRKLLKDGYVPATRVMELEAAVADYRVKLSERRSELSRADQRIGDIDIKLQTLDSDYRQQASDLLKVTNIRISDIEQELRKASDAASRQKLLAPVDGEIMGLRFTAPGGVIAPREPVMELVPDNPQLLIEAKIRTDDINKVRVGHGARVQFTAFKYRTTNAVPGKVTYVSADRMVDRETNQAYYTIEVELDKTAVSADPEFKRIQAGMSAEVYMDGETRTPLKYLMEPITDVLRKAARER